MQQLQTKNNISILNYELKALQSAGIIFNTYEQHNSHIVLSEPKITQSFLQEHNIINEPTLLFNTDSFQVALFEEFQFAKTNKEKFLEDMVSSNPNISKDSFILENLYFMQIQREENFTKKFNELFLTNINTRLQRIKGFINGTNNK